MVIQKINQHYDSKLSKEIARLALDESPVVVSYYTNETNIRSVVHSHSYHELVYNVSGSNVLYSGDGKQFTLRKGDIVFFPAEHFHSGVFNLTDNHSVRLVIQIDTSIWNLAKEKSCIDWGDEIFLVESGTVAKWDLRGLFERMGQTFYVEKDSRDMIFTAQVLELQLLVNQYMKENKASSFKAKNEIIDRAIKYIQQNYTNSAFSVEDLACQVCVSRPHLSRIFKAYTLESIHEYLTDLRMQRCRQLISEGKSILDSSIESGFSDYSSFLKTFKKLYDMTPQQFRKQLLEEMKKGKAKTEK